MYRDLAGWSYAGLPLTTTSNEAAKYYDAILTQFSKWTEDPSVGGILASMKNVVEADPDFVMGHAICTGFTLLSTGASVRTNPVLRKTVDNLVSMAKNSDITDRERKHVLAVQLWSESNYTGAAETWEDILVDFPTDMLALKMAYHTHFFLGRSAMMRDSVARVLPLWKKDSPLYSYLCGMYAFGLEETNFLEQAERYALMGLEMNPRECFSTHAYSHINDAVGRHSNGAKFLEQTEKDWEKGTIFACHNYWHWALFHIEQGNYGSALDIFDNQILKRCQPEAILSVNDASSLLYRLEMEGVSVGERWHDICSLYSQHLDDHVMVFNDLHALMACLGACDEEATSTLINSVRSVISDKRDSDRKLFVEVGLPMCEAFVAYDKADFAEAVEKLYPLRYRLIELGGSHAQRDIFHQLLVHAAIQSKQPRHKKIARLLLAERRSLREGSLLTERLAGQLLTIHSNEP